MSFLETIFRISSTTSPNTMIFSTDFLVADANKAVQKSMNEKPNEKITEIKEYHLVIFHLLMKIMQKL